MALWNAEACMSELIRCFRRVGGTVLLGIDSKRAYLMGQLLTLVNYSEGCPWVFLKEERVEDIPKKAPSITQPLLPPHTPSVYVFLSVSCFVRLFLVRLAFRPLALLEYQALQGPLSLLLSNPLCFP